MTPIRAVQVPENPDLPHLYNTPHSLVPALQRRRGLLAKGALTKPGALQSPLHKGV
jgi:hypothetical protein